MSRKFDHVTPLLRELHWLRFPERIDFKLAVLVFKCLHDLAPSYLACEFHRVADVQSRQRLRSASTADLIIPRVRRATIGGRAFPVAAARMSGTVYHRAWRHRRVWLFASLASWKQSCSRDATVLTNTSIHLAHLSRDFNNYVTCPWSLLTLRHILVAFVLSITINLYSTHV